MNKTLHPANLLDAFFSPDELTIEDELVAARNAKSSAQYAAESRAYRKEWRKYDRELNVMMDDPNVTEQQLLDQYNLVLNAEAEAVKAKEFGEIARNFEKRFNFWPYRCAPFSQAAVSRANEIEPAGLRQWYDRDGYHLEPTRKRRQP